MVHQPSGGARGQATDIQIQAEEIIKLKKQLNEIYVKHTKQPLDYIYQSMERDKVSGDKLMTRVLAILFMFSENVQANYYPCKWFCCSILVYGPDGSQRVWLNRQNTRTCSEARRWRHWTFSCTRQKRFLEVQFLRLSKSNTYTCPAKHLITCSWKQRNWIN